MNFYDLIIAIAPCIFVAYAFLHVLFRQFRKLSELSQGTKALQTELDRLEGK